MWASFAARLADSLGERRALLGPSLEALARRGEALPREAFVNAVIARDEVASEINEFFTRYDIVLCPTFHMVAPAIADYAAAEPPVPALTNWCNQAGIPAASIYCGLSDKGLPIGLQIVGRQYADFDRLVGLSFFRTSFWDGRRFLIYPNSMEIDNFFIGRATGDKNTSFLMSWARRPIIESFCCLCPVPSCIGWHMH